MKSVSIHQIRLALVSLFAIIMVIGIYVSNSHALKVSIAESAAGDNVSGWIWSENIGWISLGGDNYGVKADTSSISTGGQGALSGYAWSEHIGWISFNRADTGNPPGEPFVAGGSIAQVDWSTGKINGWAKALSANGGWDGWIKFSKYTSDAGSEYSTLVNKTTGVITGWAWGSDVVGWIDMAATTKLDPNFPPAKIDLVGGEMCTAVNVETWSGVCEITPETLTTCASAGQIVSGLEEGYCSAAFVGFAQRSCDVACSAAGGAGPWKDPAVGTCNPPNGVCEAGETTVSCPQDCKPQIKQF